jgi:hypothetical protein
VEHCETSRVSELNRRLDGRRQEHSPKGSSELPRSRYSGQQATRYALDPTHPRGRHKAIVFKSALGFDQSNWRTLKRIILDELPYHEATPGKEDLYGKRFKMLFPIKGPNGNTAEVVVTWIIKDGTDYPSLDSTWVR